jgi:hypothetical protein
VQVVAIILAPLKMSIENQGYYLVSFGHVGLVMVIFVTEIT